MVKPLGSGVSTGRLILIDLSVQIGDTNVTNMLLMGNTDVDEADPEQDTETYLCCSVSSSTQEPR